MAPIGSAARTGTNPAAGVIATRPATAPVTAPRAVGLPCFHASIAIQASAAAAAAVLVDAKAIAANPFAATALPALNPNQPNQRRPAPMKVKSTLLGFEILPGKPLRLPTTTAATSADTPELM